MPRLSPDARRGQIVEVAASHFAREGYEGLSVRAIAADAGVTRALVYHYFPGKDALLEAVLRREAEILLEVTAPDPGLSPQENLQRSLAAYLDRFSASGRLADLTAPGAEAPPLVRDLVAAGHPVQVERVLGLLGQADTPVMRLAVGAWLGFVVQAARESASNPAVPRGEVTRLCMDVLRVVTGSAFDQEAVGTAYGTPSPNEGGNR
ncbi:TetR/AcrR family transcriptional regulator [Nonomuraea sp. NPDC051941]|uniref:TetR/AcrR family transcriptional regulator n=1 Tax=Nonomuraea sp. NPDC051941 TaxID=3364373 RepID=UPI0037CB5EFA